MAFRSSSDALRHKPSLRPNPKSDRHPTRSFSPIYAGGGKKKDMSSSERERRDEESRRNERKDDVVIGKTSAKRDEKDYTLDPKATEEEYLRQASNVEQEIFHRTEQGMSLLNSLRLEEADRAFDKVFELKPSAYLWQAGIVKFYLGNYPDAADIFARNARTFESKFGSQATEERIWRDACELKFLNTMAKSRRKQIQENGDISTLIRTIPEFKSDDIFSETRKVMNLSKNLFRSTTIGDQSSEILARAKLRSLCGADSKYSTPDRKMWKLSAWFYLGLHLDVSGNIDESKKCMKMALKLCPSSGKSDDIVHTLPLLHMSARDWFDDSDFEDNPMDNDPTKSDLMEFSPPEPTIKTYAYADPLIEESIRDGVGKMHYAELREALRLRGLKTVGSKQSLQERLFYSLMDDAGFESGFAP